MSAAGASALMAPWAVRRLTAGEAALTREVFGAAVDQGRVRLCCWPLIDWTTKRPFCPGGLLWPGKSLIAWPRAYALLDFAAADAPLSATATFVHEMTHVAQSQAGVNLLFAKLKAGDRPESYRYVLSDLTRWDELNIEQQAMVVQDDFLRRRGERVRYAAHLYERLIPYPRER